MAMFESTRVLRKAGSVQPRPNRVYRVLLWTGGQAGRGESVPVHNEGRSGREAVENALRCARRLLPNVNWAASPHHAEWIRTRSKL